MEVKRIEWIDIAKAIGIFLMVMGHTGMPKVGNQWIYSFHMPLFFFLSGMLFTSGKYTFGQLLKRKTLTMVVPYMFFALISFWGGYLLDYQLFKQPSFDMLLIKGSGGAMWFIYVLLFVELIYWGIDKICNKWLIHAICLIAAVIGYLADMNGLHLLYKIEVVGMGLLFYDIGVAMKNVKALQQKLSIWLLLLLFVADIGLAYIQNPRLDMASNCYGMGIPTLALALFGIYLTIQSSVRMDNSIPLWLRKPIVYIGRNTIVIVGLSQVILMSLKKLFETYGVPNIIGSPIRHLLLWIALFAATWLLNRYVPFLIGK